jgi:hypothetical protein
LSAAGKGAEAQRELEALLAETSKYGYQGYQYQIRLALGESEMKAGKTAAGRVRLDSLKKEATSKGFLQVANKAAKAASS